MIRAGRILAQGAGSHACADTVLLDSTERHRRRATMTCVRGLEFLLDLPDALMLRSGDAIMLDDGRLVEVLGRPEPPAEIRIRDPRQLAHVAGHLGNRHLPTEIRANTLLIRDDHVIVAMLRGLGALVQQVQAPFNPEGGAYGEHNRHHDHAHGHGHSHDHGHDHDHDHAHGH